MVTGLMLHKPLPAVGLPRPRTCQFQLDEDQGSRRDFTLACPIAMAAITACRVLPDRWFTPHFAILTSSHSLLGTPLFIWPESILTSGQPVGLIVLTAPDVHRLRWFRIFGMFTFKKSASFLEKFGSNSSLLVTPPMFMHLGVFGVTHQAAWGQVSRPYLSHESC